MTTDQPIADLRALLEAQPLLMRRLDNIGSLGELAEMLALIAGENGLPLSAAQLNGRLGKVAAGLRCGVVEDEDLGRVAGGIPVSELLKAIPMPSLIGQPLVGATRRDDGSRPSCVGGPTDPGPLGTGARPK